MEQRAVALSLISKGSLLFATAVVTSCGGKIDSPQDSITVTSANDPAPASIPSWEDFKASSLRQIDGRAVYIVETDMLANDVDELWRFYDTLYLHPAQKSIVDTVGGADDIRINPRSMTYCFSPGTVGWSSRVCPAGKACYTSTSLAATQTAIGQAIETSPPNASLSSWQQTANLSFTYLQGLDGAGCTTAVVSFIVQPYDDVSAGTTGTAYGAFPRRGSRDGTQVILIPASTGISRLLAIHELGHTIGLRHEHINPSATPTCFEDNNYRLLTGYDTLSCMKYANCAVNNFINGTEISALDGIGTRSLYGAPARWFPAYSASLL